jgi:protein O-mannosyl-transferase
LILRATEPNTGGKDRLIASLLIIVLTVAVYLPIINQHFANWDDPKHVKAIWKPSMDRAWRIVTDFDLKYTNVTYYSPLHFLSLMAEQALLPDSKEPQPWVSKMMNILYHVLNVLLVFYLLMCLGTGRKAALIGALIFGVHPIQVGTVAWIAERKNLLCTLFYLGSLLAYLRYFNTGKPVNLFLLILFFVAGLLSKPAAVTLPATILAWLLIVPEEKGKSNLPYFVIALLMLVGAAWGIYVAKTEVSYPGVLPDWEYRPLLAAGAIWFYVGKLFYPVELVPVYPRWDVVGNLSVFAGLVGAFVIVAAIIIYFRKRIDTLTIWGLLFFLINILPVAGFVPFGHMGHSFVADHFMYLPMVGVAVVFASISQGGLDRLHGRSWLSEAFVAALYILVCALAVLSIKQTFLWREPRHLWEATLKVTNTSAAAYNNYGTVLLNKGENQKALEYFQKAVELSPTLDVSLANMGRAYLALGDRGKAREMLQKAIAANPTNSMARITLAAMLREQGNFSESAKLMEDSIEVLPKNALLRSDLGISYYRLGDIDGALKQFEKAIELDPFFPNPYIHRAAIFIGKRDKIDAAIDLLHKALSLSASAEAHRLLGLAYIQKHNPRKSLEEFSNAYNIDPNVPALRENIAALLLDIGQRDEAKEICAEAEEVGKPCSEETRRRMKADSEKTPVESH